QDQVWARPRPGLVQRVLAVRRQEDPVALGLENGGQPRAGGAVVLGDQDRLVLRCLSSHGGFDPVRRVNGLRALNPFLFSFLYVAGKSHTEVRTVEPRNRSDMRMNADKLSRTTVTRTLGLGVLPTGGKAS